MKKIEDHGQCCSECFETKSDCPNKLSKVMFILTVIICVAFSAYIFAVIL